MLFNNRRQSSKLHCGALDGHICMYMIHDRDSGREERMESFFFGIPENVGRL